MLYSDDVSVILYRIWDTVTLRSVLAENYSDLVKYESSLCLKGFMV